MKKGSTKDYKSIYDGSKWSVCVIDYRNGTNSEYRFASKRLAIRAYIGHAFHSHAYKNVRIMVDGVDITDAVESYLSEE